MKSYIQLTLLSLLLFVGFSSRVEAQLMQEKEQYTHADTLRGSDNPNRNWWKVLHYNITVKPDYNTKSIQGKTWIEFKEVYSIHSDTMQIDLQQPLIIDSICYFRRFENAHIIITLKDKDLIRKENCYFFKIKTYYPKDKTSTLAIYYHGTPTEAVNPPWDGGWIWKKDSLNNPWITVACQGLGASAWYPCKDYQGDKPDKGASLTVIIPDTLVAVANGRLLAHTAPDSNHLTSYTWSVTNPINNYNIIPYIGKYSNFTDTFMGLKGKLDLSYWVLDYNLNKAREQFAQVKPMLLSMEYWFGPYPFYEDGYKLVDAPHLGMEHQSAIAYGNRYQNGYLGRDLSSSGWGLKWDFIIVHESGHEWFGNNITSKDIADMWIHEAFTTYSETLFVEYYYGKKAADEYNKGERQRVTNTRNIIGPYGVNKEGSEDMYFKGTNLLHTIRHAIDNDSLFHAILLGLNKTFYHQTVTTKQIESYISKQAGINFNTVFNQYLRSSQIPELQYTIDTINNKLSFKWNNTVEGFNLRMKLQPSGRFIAPTTTLQTITLSPADLLWILNKGLSNQYYIKEKSQN